MPEVEGRRRAGVCRSAQVLLLSLLVCGCVVETTTSRRSLGGSASSYGQAPIVIADCELGQTLVESGCRDIVLTDDAGQKTNLREFFAATHCRSMYDRLKAANRRTLEYLGLPRHELRAALRRVQAECQLRAEHIEACRSAGFFDKSGGGARLAGYLEAEDACYQLADLYRGRIADGYKSAP